MSGRRGRPHRRQPAQTRAWGWHRLDDRVAIELVELSGVGRGDLVLDLGAGDGAITDPLVETGASVIAFELHPGRVDTLRSAMAGRARVVRADVTDLRLPRRPFRVVANPPFDGVSNVLERLTHHASRLERADLILPTAVARRWNDRLASVQRSRGFELFIVRRLPRHAFTPSPRIDTCVVVVTPRRGR